MLFSELASGDAALAEFHASSQNVWVRKRTREISRFWGLSKTSLYRSVSPEQQNNNNRPPHTDARGPEAVRGGGCPKEKKNKEKGTSSSQLNGFVRGKRYLSKKCVRQ